MKPQFLYISDYETYKFILTWTSVPLFTMVYMLSIDYFNLRIIQYPSDCNIKLT